MSTAIASGELDEAEDDLIGSGPMGVTQFTVFIVALLLNILDGFDVTSMSFTVHSIGDQLLIPTENLGFVFSIALAGMMIGAMFIAPISDVVGRRRVVLACAGAIGLSMIATGFATSLWHLIVLRLITGLGVGGMLASLAAITSEFTPERYRSFAVVTVTAGYPLGATIGGFVAAPMIPAYGWQSVFFLGGSCTLVLVVVAFLLIPESLHFLATRRPAGALENFNGVLRRLGREPVAELPTMHSDGESKANVLSLLTPSRRGTTLTLWSTFFFCFICLYFLLSWIPKLVIAAGMSESQGVYASVAFNGGAILGVACLGWLSSRTSLSRLIGLFLLGGAVGMLLFAVLDGARFLITSLIVIGFLLQGGFTGLYAVAAKAYPTDLRSTGVGWAIGIGRFGAVVGPYIGGVLIARGVSLEANFIIYAIPLFLSGLLALVLKVR
jgi:benzoate transport